MSWPWVVGLVAVVALLAGVAAALVAWWRRRKAPRRRTRARRVRYPVVLAHGVMGFDEVRVAGQRHAYFKGIPERLMRLGADVHVVRVPAVASVAERAEELARAVRQIPADRVNIIAHSMGGLDARYAISRLGLASKVASLTTIGTPHLGTPLADIGTKVLGEGLLLRRVLAKLGLDVGGFYDLTTARMLTFNRDVPDAAKVRYASYVARAPGATQLHPLLLPAHLYLRERAGENDGLVPITSQPWGEVLGTLDADHWAQIGWSARFDAPAFYADVVRALASDGL